MTDLSSATLSATQNAFRGTSPRRRGRIHGLPAVGSLPSRRDLRPRRRGGSVVEDSLGQLIFDGDREEVIVSTPNLSRD